MPEATGLYGQTVRFDGQRVEIGPRLGGIAAYYGHPGNEARTDTAVVCLDEITRARFRRASWGRRGRLHLLIAARADETSTPWWWLHPTPHPRVATIWFSARQQAQFDQLWDAMQRTLAVRARP